MVAAASALLEGTGLNGTALLDWAAVARSCNRLFDALTSLNCIDIMLQVRHRLCSEILRLAALQPRFAQNRFRHQSEPHSAA